MISMEESLNELEQKVKECVTSIVEDDDILQEQKQSLLDWYSSRGKLQFVEKHVQSRWIKELSIYPNYMLIDRLKSMQTRLEHSYGKC